MSDNDGKIVRRATNLLEQCKNVVDEAERQEYDDARVEIHGARYSAYTVEKICKYILTGKR